MPSERNSAATTRRPGRPRDNAAEQAILDAVVELLKERGFGGLTIAGVAARAGVGKPTVYRRWASKPDLVIDAVERLSKPIAARRTGDLHTDLRRLLGAVIAELTSPPLGAAMIAMLADMHADPALALRVQRRLAQPRRNVIRGVIEQGIEHGELRPDTDSELMLNLLIGPPLYRWLTTGKVLSGAGITRVVDTVWGAFENRRA